MRIGISNIAWDVDEDESVAALLRRYQVDAIDIAPSKYFPQPAEADTADMRRLKDWWAARGIEITGMQALLFGTTGLNVFGSPASQAAMLQHLDGVCRIGACLGAPRVVFGSPKNRDRSALTDAQTASEARSFFRRLGDIAAVYGVMICLEPNPPCYGANFLTNCEDTALLVQQISHSAIRMQFDTGALTINGEGPSNVLQSSAFLIGHVHVSEPQLLPLGDCFESGTDHACMAKALSAYLPQHLVTIEMLATKSEPHLVAIERALKVAIRHYRDENQNDSSSSCAVL